MDLGARAHIFSKESSSRWPSSKSTTVELTLRHRMYEKAEELEDKCGLLETEKITPTEFQLLFNSWDCELTEYMYASESKCNKRKNDSIELSPVVGLWLRRLHLYQAMTAYHDGLMPDP